MSALGYERPPERIVGEIGPILSAIAEFDDVVVSEFDRMPHAFRKILHGLMDVHPLDYAAMISIETDETGGERIGRVVVHPDFLRPRPISKSRCAPASTSAPPSAGSPAIT